MKPKKPLSGAALDKALAKEWEERQAYYKELKKDKAYQQKLKKYKENRKKRKADK